MAEFLRWLRRLLNMTDAKAIASGALSVALLVFVLFMFLSGGQWLNLYDETALTQALARAAESPWAVLGVIFVYSLLALTGFPQIVLFAVTIFVFGAVAGAAYSWIATMVSAMLTFGFGRFLGGRWIRRMGGDPIQRTFNFVRHRGILTSALIRLVPSAPFIFVNATAGAADIPLWKFWIGTGVGIIPKILLVAILGAFAPDAETLKDGVAGLAAFFAALQPRDLAILAMILVAWTGILLLARRLYRRLRTEESVY